ncbi:MAG: citrate transporter [Clostridium butyricum]|nr:citrate transporter [Clostridium butyricum]MDU5820420.1 citrate transporter [Clostridium butyricum]
MSVEFIIGILLLVSFAGLVAYAVKGGNLMTGILIMAIIWTVLPLIGNALVTNPDFIAQNSDIVNMSIVDALKKVFQGGPEGWGGVLINFIFGAWFGRIMLETGIAATIIRKTVELGGDKPIVTSTLLAIVTTAVFSSMFGAGAVVAIGVIVLPILLSLGIPKLLATVSFLLSIGSGLYINPVIFNQYQAFYLGANGEQTYFYNGGYLKWGFVALAVQLIVAILIPAILMKKQKRVHAWAAQAPQTEEVKAASEVFNKTFYDGAIDTAPLVGFMLMIPMFNKAAELCVPYFNAVLGGLIPNNTLVICVAFAVLAPLGMFRGPFTLAGCGAATLGILKSVGFGTPLLFPLMYAPTVTMNILSCITQSWIVWGLGYTKVDTKDFLKLSIPAGWLICAILSLITYIMFGM